MNDVCWDFTEIMTNADRRMRLTGAGEMGRGNRSVMSILISSRLNKRHFL